MTKKHFIAIAHCLNANHAPLALVLDFADMLEEENPRFDRGAFVTASTGNLAANLRQDQLTLTRERV